MQFDGFWEPGGSTKSPEKLRRVQKSQEGSKVRLGKKSQGVQKVGWSKESGEGKSQRVTKVI